MERYAYADAARAFEQACKAAPGAVQPRINLAIAVYNRAGKGDLQRAEAILDQVLRDQPDNTRAQYFRGITHQYSGRDQQALACFERVVEAAPHDATAWYLLARSKAHLGQPSRPELERAIKENPGLASAYYDLMRVAAQEEKQDEALALQETFTKLRESPLAQWVTMPQYRRMGPLGTVRPMAAAPDRSVTAPALSVGPKRILFEEVAGVQLCGLTARERATPAGKILARHGVQFAMADVNGDGHLDLVTNATIKNAVRSVAFLSGRSDGGFAAPTRPAGLATTAPAMSCAIGDYDNDDVVDVFVSCSGPNHLFRGRGDGTFEDVTASTRTAGPNVISVSAAFLDADHDGDLDIYVCNAATPDGAATAANQLWNNNGDGTFTDIAGKAGVACATERSVMIAPADLDGDRDADLVVFNEAAAPRIFFNDRSGRYHEGWILDDAPRSDGGGVSQDFNADGRPDLLISPCPEARGRLYLTDEAGALQASTQFDGCLDAVATWGAPTATRVADVDLDGDLDIVVFCYDGHLMLNDGRGRFIPRARFWRMPRDTAVTGLMLTDVTGDGLPDLLSVGRGGGLQLVPTSLTPPANWVAITPTGSRGADKRTRSPTSGFGTRVELRCGLHSQVLTRTGLYGGPSQSQLPMVMGLSGAAQADYIALTWPDGVTQCEIHLAARSHHVIREMERRVSSCPVLFAWDGTRFGFVADFAGVGGLGYYVAPGNYASPQALDQVRIAPGRLVARDGLYELRICEPMEEVAYVDRLELLAVDHPRGVQVFPDESLAVTGAGPTRRLLCVKEPIFPVRALAPDGTDCTQQLMVVDRVSAYQPEVDRRFTGFCRPHTLVLDFADRLSALSDGHEAYLFLTCSIDYPYSQTTYAAAQAGVVWQAIKIECQIGTGPWETVVADAGAPGGIGRTIAIELTGVPRTGACKLRLSTNLEIYYDQVFVAADLGTADVAVRSVPLVGADLRRLGFPMEVSPDGRPPTIYTYDIIEQTSSFKTPAGAYTRYGRVDDLLGAFDDAYVIMGTGDEIAVRFDATALPPVPAGRARSFVLVSHAYCKDMDLYTAEPDTVEPLPFRGMSTYPYPPGEHLPDEGDTQRWRRRWNTRIRP